jgi:hypothetical protein
MRLQPNRDYVSDDVVQTPPALARRLVAHFRPRGRILEPCAGEGNFLKALRAHVRSSELRRLSSALRRQPLPASSKGVTEREARRWSARGLRQALARSAAKGDSRRAPLGDESHKLPRGSHVYACEIKRGTDFFAWTQRVDWIVTNPPWSQIRKFLQHALRLADHVVFLLTINHLWTRARLRDVKAAGFGVREIVLLDTPKSFPQSGFQLGAVYLRRRWTGPVILTDWCTDDDVGTSGTRAGVAKSARDHTEPELEEMRELNHRLDALLAEAVTR